MANSGVNKKAVTEDIGKNLLKNPCGASDLEGWNITKKGGDGWGCEKKPAGCKPIKEFNKEAKGDTCWSTSFQDCEKKQLIKLVSDGFDPDYMDKNQPEIRFSEWFGSRSDAGCTYWLTVRLLNSEMKVVDEKLVKETKVAKGDWYQVEGSFKDYGPGVRFVEYSHGGRDTCDWKGHYGAKITCSFVAVRENIGKNLLKNPAAASDLEGWDITKKGGDGWGCEKNPGGCKPIKEAIKEAKGDTCWSTSFKDCEKKQVINLGINRFDPDYMDTNQPEIKFSEWFGTRSDAGIKYWLTVRLLNSEKKVVEEKHMDETRVAKGDWFKVEGSFKGYGSGVRFVEYSHGGRDTCNWKGRYGAKITCSFLAVM